LCKHCRQQIFSEQWRLLRNTVFIMAFVQTHHNGFKGGNVVCLNHRRRDGGPIAQIGTLTEHAWRRVFLSLSRQWTLVTQRLAQRRARRGPTMAERARQRRELERLTDRELRDIGITRYEIEFVLRQSAGFERRG
jgi:uncharacterized protein YjiS (DUF1127 family)